MFKSKALKDQALGLCGVGVMLVGSAAWTWAARPAELQIDNLCAQDTQSSLMHEHEAAGGRPVQSVWSMTEEELIAAVAKANQRMESACNFDTFNVGLRMGVQVAGSLLLLLGSVAVLQQIKTAARTAPSVASLAVEEDTGTSFFPVGG